ncbi:MAG: CPBP family intramembrane metalloprotease [Bacteroidales bacterium]|nr:MAG: CPBP family intramembrane metalloprotease [Bacteroidales bacterium]
MEYFLLFLKRPSLNNDQKKVEWRHIFIILFSFYLVMLPIGFFIKLMNSFFNISQKHLSFDILHKILLAVVIAPIVEELLFRILLVINKRNLIIFSFTSLILSAYSLLKAHYYYSVILLILSILAVTFSTKEIGIRNMTTKYYSIYFYAIAIFFGFVHFTNYDGISGFLYLWIPFLVLPQFLMGVFLGYVRLSFGIIYSILVHSVINLIAIGSL